MIIAGIMPCAGMGNQMFMYAAGLAAASRLGTELLIDTATFINLTSENRPYRLSYFPAITEHSASLQDILKIGIGLACHRAIYVKPIRGYHVFRRLIRKILTVTNSVPIFHDAVVNIPKNAPFPYPYKLSRICIDNKAYKDRLSEIPDNSYLAGYWESEDYFADCAGLVRRKFTFPSEYLNTELADRVTSCNSVAIHVRRTDKVREDDSQASNLHYIKNAIERITSMTDSPEFFVFSDDIQWCKENLSKAHEADYHFIEGQTPPQDMALMTKCRHVIMGPSTFSWWGAWLNDNPSKIIIAPARNVSMSWYPRNALIID